MESRELAESAAAAWIARRECDDWSGDDQIQLDAWINASTDNRVACCESVQLGSRRVD
jgi:transmembrane sensor